MTQFDEIIRNVDFLVNNCFGELLSEDEVFVFALLLIIRMLDYNH